MRLHLRICAILNGKWAIEHVVEDDRGQKQTSIFHLTLEIGSRVVVYPNSTSRLGSWWGAKCCLINTVNSMDGPLRSLPACIGLIFGTAARLGRSTPYAKYDFLKMDPCRPVEINEISGYLDTAF